MSDDDRLEAVAHMDDEGLEKALVSTCYFEGDAYYEMAVEGLPLPPGFSKNPCAFCSNTECCLRPDRKSNLEARQ